MAVMYHLIVLTVSVETPSSFVFHDNMFCCLFFNTVSTTFHLPFRFPILPLIFSMVVGCICVLSGFFCFVFGFLLFLILQFSLLTHSVSSWCCYTNSQIYFSTRGLVTKPQTHIYICVCLLNVHIRMTHRNPNPACPKLYSFSLHSELDIFFSRRVSANTTSTSSKPEC